MKFLLLLLSFIATSLVRADDPGSTTLAPTLAPQEKDDTWAGCWGAGGSSNRIKIGSPMFLCLHVGNNRNWTDSAQFIRLSFSPKADEYSRLHVPNCKYKHTKGEQKELACFARLVVVVVVSSRLLTRALVFIQPTMTLSQAIVIFVDPIV